MGLRNIRFSGGEPTLWSDLIRLVSFTRERNVKRIAISTNGSADFALYRELVNAGVNDVSISLDACCSATGAVMSGQVGAWELVCENIRRLSALTYVTVGVVLTKTNISELERIVRTALSLGVSDVRLITAAQLKKCLPENSINWVGLQEYPILTYRLRNLVSGRPVRGLSEKDAPLCPLVLDDMAVIRGYHFPCIIYLREYGDPIGAVSSKMREERRQWFENHNCLHDEICRNNCLDVCVDYNKRVFELNKAVRQKVS
jgi:hypothetical protein